MCICVWSASTSTRRAAETSRTFSRSDAARLASSASSSLSSWTVLTARAATRASRLYMASRVKACFTRPSCRSTVCRSRARSGSRAAPGRCADSSSLSSQDIAMPSGACVSTASS